MFAWSREIEREWQVIREELDGLLQRKDDLPGVHEIIPGAELVSRDRGWKSFILLAMTMRSEKNIARCPQTWRVVQRIPGLTTAMFSVFEPGKRLAPHRGPYAGVLRLHLGLIVPDEMENVGMRVGSRECRWEEGKVLIFDDTYEHEAWNEAHGVRVVLFVDFTRPLRFPMNVVNRFVLKLVPFLPFGREGRDNERAWERMYYRPRAS